MSLPSKQKNKTKQTTPPQKNPKKTEKKRKLKEKTEKGKVSTGVHIYRHIKLHFPMKNISRVCLSQVYTLSMIYQEANYLKVIIIPFRGAFIAGGSEI